MITDFNGAPSITLTEFAAQCRYEEDVAVLRRLLKKLKRYLLDNHIVTMSLKPQNILCQRISESEVVPVVCDNLGKVPLSRWRPRQHGAVNANWRVWQRFIAQPALAVAPRGRAAKDKKRLALTSHEA